MSDVSEQVAVLIKELLVLNRRQHTPLFEPPTLRDVEERKSKRIKLRQELVHALSVKT